MGSPHLLYHIHKHLVLPLCDTVLSFIIFNHTGIGYFTLSFTLTKERKAVRADIELKGTKTIEKAIGKKHSFRIYLQSKEKADEIVDGIEREQKKRKPRGKGKPHRTKDTERIA